MKVILSFIFVVMGVASMGQSTLPLRADTVLVEKTGGSGELKIKNSTRDSLGLLVNIGGGRTRFMRVRQITDTSFIIPNGAGGDTIRIISGGSGGGTGSVTQVNSGYGLDGGPITTTGTLLVDSAELANYFQRRKDSALYVTTTRLGDTAAAIRADFPAGGGAVVTDVSLLGTGTALDPLKIDSGLLANHIGYDSLSLDTLGVIYNKTSWALLGEFFTAIGGVSASVVSNKISIASSGANDFNRYLLTEYKSKIEHWRLQSDIIINNTPSATTYGIGIGKVSNPIGWVDLSTGVDAGKIYLNSSTTQLAVSGSAITFSNLDTISLELRQAIDTVYFTVRNKTTGGAAITITYAYDLDYGQAIEPPVASPFAVFEKGGAYILNNLTLTSAEPINVPIVWIGTSKALGQYAASFGGRSSQLMNDRYTITTNFGLSGGTMADFLLYLPEIRSLRGKEFVIVDGGSNDKRQGIPGATWRTNYRKLVDSLVDMGAKVYHAPVWENSLDLSDIVTFIDSTYPGKRFLTYEAMQACGVACLVADNVHPNARGNDTLATVIIRDGRLLRNNYRLNIRYVDGRGMGSNQSATASLVVNNNGQFLKSSSSVLGLYQQNGNAFGGTAILGTTDNNNINLIRNGFPLIRYNDYPNHLLFYDKSGDEVVRIRADSVNNIAYGKGSHASLTTGGTGNTAVGSNAGLSLTTATNTTNIGFEAGRSNIIGQRNTNIGASANYYSTGSFNAVGGSFAGSGQPTATYSGASLWGDGAGYLLTSAVDVTAIGRGAGDNGTSLSNSIAIGAAVDFPSATANGQIVIGNLYYGAAATGTGTAAAGRAGIALTTPLVTLHIGGTDATGINGGTTVQRPTGAAGYLRWNTDSVRMEIYTGTKWVSLLPGDVSTSGGTPSLTSTHIGVGDGSNLLSGSAALTYTGTEVQQINSGAVSKVINNAALSATSGAASALYTYNTPTASTDQIGIINFGSAGAGANNYIGASIAGFANGPWTGGSSHFSRLVFSTTNSGSATPSEVMRIANGRVSIGTGTTGTAYLTLRAGGSGSNAAPLKFSSGTNQATPEAGAMEYDGSNFYLSPSTTRKRIPLYTDATATSGSLLVGNGTDFTLQTTATTFPVQQYTPTLTGVSNVTGLSTSDLYFQRIGMRVHVWGTVGIDPTSTLTLTEVGVSLPVASTIGNISVCSGSGYSDTIAQGIAIKGDTVNDRATISFFCGSDASSVNYFFHFNYEITPP